MNGMIQVAANRMEKAVALASGSMTKGGIRKGVIACAAILALAMMAAPRASATCKYSPGAKNVSRAMIPADALLGQITPAAQSNDGERENENEKGPSIVGLWKIAFSSGGQVVDQGFDLWTSDGTEILNDTTPPAEGNVCLGVWEKVGPRTFQLYHPSWTFDANGNLTGTAIIREVVTLDRKGQSFSGTSTIDFIDLDNNNVGHLDGQVQATRIKVN